MLLHVWMVVFAVEQLGIDHQREDIYPFLVWFFFGAPRVYDVLRARVMTVFCSFPVQSTSHMASSRPVSSSGTPY